MSRDPWVDLLTAARTAGRSIRTIRRWVSRGLVAARDDPRDRRRTLVRLADVHRRLDDL